MEDADFHKIARALSDPNRVTILQNIRGSDRMSCGAMVERLPLAQATVSHHLKELVVAGLLDMTSEGQFNYYAFREDCLTEFIAELRRRFCLAHK